MKIFIMIFYVVLLIVIFIAGTLTGYAIGYEEAQKETVKNCFQALSNLKKQKEETGENDVKGQEVES